MVFFLLSRLVVAPLLLWGALVTALNATRHGAAKTPVHVAVYPLGNNNRVTSLRWATSMHLLNLNFGYSLETGYISKAKVPHSILLKHDYPHYPGTDLIIYIDPYVKRMGWGTGRILP